MSACRTIDRRNRPSELLPCPFRLAKEKFDFLSGLEVLLPRLCEAALLAVSLQWEEWRVLSESTEAEAVAMASAVVEAVDRSALLVEVDP